MSTRCLARASHTSVNFLKNGEPVHHSYIEHLHVAPILLEKAPPVLDGAE